MKYDFTFMEKNVINTTIYANSKEEAEQKILNREYVDEGGGDKSIDTIVCNSEEWEYPEDTWTSVKHEDNYLDLNFWTDHEDKKMLTIYLVKPDKDDPENKIAYLNTCIDFELKTTEGDIQSIVKALGIDLE
jgi:hypothetical protein